MHLASQSLWQLTWCTEVDGSLAPEAALQPPIPTKLKSEAQFSEHRSGEPRVVFTLRVLVLGLEVDVVKGVGARQVSVQSGFGPAPPSTKYQPAPMSQ